MPVRRFPAPWRAGSAGLALVCASAALAGSAGAQVVPPPNVLLVIADDVGVDRLASYGLGTDPAPTPTLDALAADGVQFERAWSSPMCSPTRAWLLTGRYGQRTGIGAVVVAYSSSYTMPHDTWTLPKLLAAAAVPYVGAAVGKWHLSTWSGSDGLDPLAHGFASHAGSHANLNAANAVDGLPQDYFDWEKLVDGVRTRTTTYATTDTTDEAIAAIGSLPEPWLVWAAYNAPHVPFHEPPPGLWGGPEPQNAPEEHDAMLAALDAELGRLLGAIDPVVLGRTLIVFVGDNGTPSSAARPPLDPGLVKGTVYEGGVRVPLLMAGAGVTAPGGRVQAPVSLVDLYATFAELAGVPPGHAALLASDGVSLVPYLADPAHPPLRQTVYSERFRPNGFGPYIEAVQAARDARYKLIRHADGSESLYDLGDGWLEGTDLMPGPLTPTEHEAWRRLAAELDAIPLPEPGRATLLAAGLAALLALRRRSVVR